VAAATALVGHDAAARRVVVVLSDGDDTASRTTLAALSHELAGSGVQVDAVGLTASGAYTAGALRSIAAATGGVFEPAQSAADLEPVMAGLAQSQLSGRFSVDVTLPRSSSRELQVAVLGGSPAHVKLPAGVSGTSPSLIQRYGGWLVIVIGFAAVLMVSFV